MKHFTHIPVIFLLAPLLGIGLFSCDKQQKVTVDELTSYIDTRVGTAASATKTAGLFGKKTEEYGQTLPAVLAPNGMNFWTPQTRDTELKCISPYYYKDTLFQGFRNSHWIVGGCTQDYGSMTLMPLFDKLICQPVERATPFSHDNEVAKPYYYGVNLPEQKIYAEMTGDSRSAIFRFTYDEAGKAYLVVNPNSDEGEGFI
ncbi:MAG: GH92 family glycosyl hydrolase, partial [Phocaeicola sp.]